MSPVAEPSSSSKTIGEHIKLRRPRNQTSRHIRPICSTVAADDPPLTHVVPTAAQPTRLCKSAMSLFLVPTTSNNTSLPTRKKPIGFSQAASFRGLGCTAAASQQVSVPAVIRSSAEWGEEKKAKDKRKKNSNKKKNGGGFNGGSIKILSESRGGGVDGGGCVAIPDVWCGPGIGFSTDAVVGGSVDPVVSGPSRRNLPARRKIDGDRSNSSSNNNYNHRESSSVLPRRSPNQEFPPFWDSDPTFVTSRPEPTLFPNRQHRHFRHPYAEGLAEIMMLQNGFVMGGVFDSHDHFRDLRLDVDNMSYEQLLELGDRIGYVNTGLKEEEINRCLRKIKPSISDADKKCSICQEEYGIDEETGKLNCGHSFHVECVKQWLSRKNACPVCKTEANPVDL
ncbi:PREDICTED: E3 ubiquitin-protein ligase MBR1 [Tarenaya hassleriana]|uniref:E3 ubiquitin-protein ligase MBR1 n=1 Tax=Tarenaya hassleriana TaxID=28532 RepID=UPI0008FD5FCB|nr:PREDICTED: E3 ubiquitin-protein ligase MBR1 [Tarenaya hassleriana]